LDEWLDLPPDSRPSWLAGLGPEHRDVLPALRQLIASQGIGDDQLLQTLAKIGDSTAILSSGRRLGPYRILSAIGRGGMGAVYRGERADGKFEQRVAIKVVSGGLSTPAFIERFQREYRILASLDHPNVARLLDAGTTEEGLPYFVMEYVEGRPIDRFSEERNLSVSDRLRLILPVCDAVQLAHRQLVVHCDLKPDNILVTEQGIPKLLDFGIAKVLSECPGGAENTLMAMTPAYASPEQIRGEPVGTATDVYSMGCVLYKLLTGAPPHQLQGKSPAESVRWICEEEPRRPATLNHALGADEDNIIRMAMRKDAHGRYRSVEQLAADISRYLCCIICAWSMGSWAIPASISWDARSRISRAVMLFPRASLGSETRNMSLMNCITRSARSRSRVMRRSCATCAAAISTWLKPSMPKGATPRRTSWNVMCSPCSAASLVRTTWIPC
jgi:serine/threonine protein kinase